jgi:predicted Rossmann fold nucleotide-binding protein DprA/Smf involved in DNA uptake
MVLLERLKPWKKYTNAVAREEEKIHEQQGQTLYLGDPDYPKTLSFCPDAPLVFFYKGISVFGPRKRISIVGTRLGDAAGENMCCKLISELRELQPTIVSGLPLESTSLPTTKLSRASCPPSPVWPMIWTVPTRRSTKTR